MNKSKFLLLCLSLLFIFGCSMSKYAKIQEELKIQEEQFWEQQRIQEQLLCAPPAAGGVQHYVAQYASGSGNGDSCANATPISYYSGSWSGKVAAGDTLHLCGTLTSTLTIGASGSAGSPITILFEPGAKFSKAYWVWSSPAIVGGSYSYIIIDGGTNGIIENTDNGSALAYQQNTLGISLSGGSNVEVKNVTIQNMYVRSSDIDYASACSDSSQGIFSMGGGSNISIHDNHITYCARGMSLYFGANGSEYSVYNNTFENGNSFIWSAPTGNFTINNFNIYNNIANMGIHWNYPSGDRWHSEYIHIHTDAGGYMNNVKIYGNAFGPYAAMKTDTGDSSTSGWIFDEAKGNNRWIYNNLFTTASGYGATNGIVSRQSSSSGTGYGIFNNTFVKSGTTRGNAIYIGNVSDKDLLIKNNIIFNYTHGIYVTGTLTLNNVNQIDYNVYYGVANWYQFSSWSTWKGLGYDAHSTSTSNPALDNNYVPLLSDTVAKDKGVSLSSYFTADKLGNTRTGTWDIGAYEYGIDKAQSTLVVTSSNGTVTSNPEGINCGTTCSADYDSETSVTLTAVPNSGYIFSGWSGACSGTDTCTVTMNEAKFVTANFAIPSFKLTVAKAGTGSGTVTGSDGLINCGSTCSANYESGKAVTLTASSASGSVFSGWSGACSGTGPCIVTMTAAKSVTATFLSVYNLTVTKSIAGAGNVTSSDGAINCGSVCSANYYPQTSVTLSASANTGYVFTGWQGGGCSGTGSCSIPMTAATSVTATFATAVYNLTVTKPGTGTGTVTGSDGLINCGYTCSANYESGKSVTLTASAASGSTFTGWSGACSGTGSCILTMTSAQSVTANFALPVSSVTYYLSVSKNILTAGTVIASDGTINCGSTCRAYYRSGNAVTLTASPRRGYKFSKWTGACSGTGTCTVSINASKTVKAYFVRQ